MSKTKIWLFLKISVSIFILIFLFKSIGWKDFWSVLKGINLFYIIPLFLVSSLMIAISCVKWQILLTARKININIFRLMSLYLIGYFFNNFMPGQYGGDLARAYIFGRSIKNHVESLASIFLERFTGLSALIGMTFLASIANFRFIRESNLLFAIVLIIAGYLLFLFVLFNHGLNNRIKNMRVSGYMERVRRKIGELHDVIMSFKEDKQIVSKTLGISFLFHTMTIINILFICMALSVDVKILDIALIVPIVLLVSMIPVSINSIGIQEGAFVYFFSIIGVSFPTALSVAMVLRAKNLVLALIGGVIFASRGKAHSYPANQI